MRRTSLDSKRSSRQSFRSSVRRLSLPSLQKQVRMIPGSRLTTVVGATSGCTPAVPGYFVAMKEVCEKHGALFVLDEVRTRLEKWLI